MKKVWVVSEVADVVFFCDGTTDYFSIIWLETEKSFCMNMWKSSIRSTTYPALNLRLFIMKILSK